jgi:geranylgeranyl reductase family protein
VEHFDVIIVGAGPGGSNAAAVALRGGLRVVQIDAATFPRVKPCAGGLTAKAAAALQPEFGALSALPFNAIEFNVWRHRGNRFGHRDPVLHTVCRPDFDNALVQRNLAHAEFTFVDGCRALRIDYDGRFTVTTTKGALTGRQLIGADGAYSVVNRTFRVSAPRAFATALEINIPAPAGQSMVPCFDYGAIDCGYGWVFPKSDHLSVGLYTVSPRTRQIRSQFLTYVRSKRLPVGGDSLPDLEAFRVPVGGFRLTAPECPVYVVGDAGGFADALTGEGIYAALESGRLAGETAVRLACGCATHRVYYRRLWRSVLCDTALTFFAARHFYKDIDRGVRLLERPLVWRTLIEGAARGATLSESALKSGSLVLQSVASGAVASQFVSA